MNKILILSILFLVSLTNLSAQYNINQNKVWPCGYHAGVDFSTGSPVAMSSSILMMEGCASVCDASSNLLFYTDGLTVWDATGAVMPSGASIVPFGTYSTTQAAVIVPVIGNPNQYYIFSLETFDYTISGNCNLAYSIVDMTLNSGLGDISSSGTALGSGYGEKMTAVAGNNCNIWVIVHDRDNPAFYAYSIDASGISSPVTSTVGTYTGAYKYAPGVIKVSPDRSKIVTVPGNYAPSSELFDFDPSTGIVSNCRVLNCTNSGGCYGAEFSPNSGLLYIADPYSGTMTQMDVTLSTAAAIVASANVVATTSGYYGDIRLAPDGKIYVTTYIYNNLDCITSPNTYGGGCGYTTNVLAGIPMTSVMLGFPNIFIADPTPPAILGVGHVCVGWTLSLSDAMGGGTWTSASPSVATVDGGTGVVTGVSAGTSDITYTTALGCSVWVTVTVDPTPSISGTPLLCVGGIVMLTGSPLPGTWSGSTPIATVVNTGTPGQGKVTGVAQGTATLTYTNPRYTCPAIITVSVDIPAVINGPSQVCEGSSIALTTGGALYGTWSSSSTSTATVGSSSGIVTGVAAGVVTISYVNACGTYTYPVTVNVTPTLPATASLCVGTTTTLTPTPAGGTWSGSSTVASVSMAGVVTASSQGTVVFTYTLGTGCKATISVSVDVMPSISGPHSVCVGSSIGLSNGGALYGAWSSSNTGIATVGSLTGIVTGVAAGTATITYTNACATVTYSVTVNDLPVITGTAVLCPSTTTTLSATPPGGVWSGGGGVATIGSSSGIVTALSVMSGGTTIVTYTDPNGCSSTLTVTVSPTPIVTGPSTICIGSTGPMNTTVGVGGGGGTWTSSNTGVATIGSSSGYITGVSAGTTIITYTDACGIYTLTVTVNWCCLTNSIIINTGYDPMAAAAITPVTNLATPTSSNVDPHWTVSNISTAAYYGISTAGGTAVTLGNGADAVNTSGGWATFAGTSGQAGTWISCLNANYYYSDPSYGTDDYWETFTRTFELCSDDNITIDINIACDNYCLGISIDGAAPYYTQASPGIPGCISSFLSAPTTVSLLAGVHTIDVTVVDYENSGWTIPYNYGGLGIWGTVSSATSSNSIISENNPYCSGYICSDGARHSNPTKPAIGHSGINVVPNPNNGTFALVGTLPEMSKNTSAQIEVVDMLGKTVYTDVASLDNGAINKAISLGENVANGVYMIRINTDNASKILRFTLNR